VEEGTRFFKKNTTAIYRLHSKAVEIIFENLWPVQVSDSDPYPYADLVLHGTVQYLRGRVRMSFC
jgi:hypothetical protein